MSDAKVAYFDCIAGASGDMILGALVDAGLAEDALRDRLMALRLASFGLRCRKVHKSGFAATKVDVVVRDDATERRLPEIIAIVEASDLSDRIKEQAVGIFRRVGEAEARIHGKPLEQVHLHELGGIDTIVDVVGTLVGLEELNLRRIVVSPLPLGSGFVTGAHGRIPLPAPATLELLKGVPVVGSDIAAELVTPTGAALLTSVASRFGTLPSMTVTAIGYGAGTRDLPIPNVLRLLVGEESSPNHVLTESMVVLESNIDDLNPELYDHVMALLLAAGASDVYLTPLQMKKNRPGTMIGVLCRPSEADALADIMFTETTTLGIRQVAVMRRSLPRSFETVETPYGPVKVKVARLGEGVAKASPEYDDCRRLAEELGVPLREVYRAAEGAVEVARHRRSTAHRPSTAHRRSTAH